jgi:hypothetical protein
MMQRAQIHTYAEVHWSKTASTRNSRPVRITAPSRGLRVSSDAEGAIFSLASKNSTYRKGDIYQTTDFTD